MARPRKQPTERIIEALTWASVVIWLGFTLIAHILNYVWLVVLVLSVILLSSAIYQRSRNWETSLSLWVFGIWMAVFSVLETVNEMIKLMNDGSGLNIDLWVYLGVALVSMGVAAIFNMIKPSDMVGADSSLRPTDYNLERDYAPRRVDQGSVTSAYMPAAQDSVRYSSQGRSTSAPPDYGRDSASRAREYARRVDDPFDRVPDYDVDGGDYGQYTDPRRAQAGYTDAAFGDTGYYDDASRRQTAYDAPRDPRRARPVDETGWGSGATYGRPTQERPYEGERLSRQRGRGNSQPQRSQQRAPRRQAQQAPPAQPQSSDLESRVEDIIRRSRSQRGGVVDTGGEDLPY